MNFSSSSTLQDVESMLFWSFSPEPYCLDDDDVTTAPAPPPPPLPEVASRSAFASYTGAQAANASMTAGSNSSHHRNVHKRVIGFLRRIPRSGTDGAGSQVRGSRGFRHMMRERQRREKMSQCYTDLYNILPYVQKGDKNSIVQTATAYIQHLKGRKEGLRMHNEELIKERNSVRESKEIKERNSVRESKEEEEDEEAAKIKIREEANPASTVDSMIGALGCLKAMDVKARAISAEFSSCELTTVVSIETTGENIVGVY